MEILLLHPKLELWLEHWLDAVIERNRVNQLRIEAADRGRINDVTLPKKINRDFTGRIRTNRYRKIDEVTILEQAEDF